MAKASTDIRSLARAHTETAIKTLAGIMREKKAPPAARVSAAQALLDRGWGKAVQPVDATIDDKRDVSELSTAEILARTAAILAGHEDGAGGKAQGKERSSDVRKLN